MKKIILLIILISITVPGFSLGQRAMRMPILYTDPLHCGPCFTLESILNSRFPDWKNYIHTESTFSPIESIPYLEDQFGKGISGVNEIAQSITNYVREKKQEEVIERQEEARKKQEKKIHFPKKDIPPQPKTIQAPPVIDWALEKHWFYAYCTFEQEKKYYRCAYLDEKEDIRYFYVSHIPEFDDMGTVNVDFAIMHQPFLDRNNNVRYEELLNDINTDQLRKDIRSVGEILKEEERRLALVKKAESGNSDATAALETMPPTRAQKMKIKYLKKQEENQRIRTAEERDPFIESPQLTPPPSRRHPPSPPRVPNQPYYPPLPYQPQSWEAPPTYQPYYPPPRWGWRGGKPDVSPWGN